MTPIRGKGHPAGRSDRGVALFMSTPPHPSLEAPNALRDLLPYQQQVLAWARNRPFPALFLEMRLGKTVIAIRWARNRTDHLGSARVLVLAPLTTLTSWQCELELEGAGPVYTLHGSRQFRQRLARSPGGWFLLNYEGLRADPALAALPWDAVIADESTRIRNPRALITKICTRSFAHVRARAILSGMPAPEGPEDYHSQFSFLHGSFMDYRSFWAWRQRYFRQGWDGFSWVPKPGTVEAIKKAVHRDAYLLTRRDANVGSLKMHEMRTVPMLPEQKRLYRQIARDLIASIPTGTMVTKYHVVKLLWLARLAGGFYPDGKLLNLAKINELVSLMDGELRDEQLIVWFRFNAELHETARQLKRYPFRYAWITGATSYEERAQISQNFRKGDCRVLLMQTKCGRFGLDLSSSSTAVYYSNGYDAEDRAQSEDRIVHPTKYEPLLLVDLVSSGSTDSIILRALRKKIATSSYFMQRHILEQLREQFQKH